MRKTSVLQWGRYGAGLLCLLTVCVAMGMAHAEAAGPDARALLVGAMEYAAGLETKGLKVAMTADTRLGDSTRSNTMTAELALRGEQDLYLHAENPSSEAKVYSLNGKQYVYLVTDRRYAEQEAGDRQNMIGMMGGGPLRVGSLWLAGFLHAHMDMLEDAVIEYVGEEPANEGDAALSHRVRVLREEFDTDMWIAKGDAPLLQRFVIDLTKSLTDNPEPGKAFGVDVKFTLSDWRVNTPLPDETFAFTPPEGVSKITQEDNHGQGRKGEDPMVGETAPEISLDLLDGGTMTLSQHKGKDVVILDFWASWCGPCRMSLPIVADVAAQYASKGVAFYAVNVNESPEKARAFLEQSKLSMPVALDKDGKAGRLYGADSIPRLVIIDKEGVVRAGHRGASMSLKDELSKELDAILGAE